MTYDTIIAKLEAVKEGFEAENRSRVDAALTDLIDAYDTVRREELSRIDRLQAARTESELSIEAHQVISNYERWFMTASFGRGSLLAGGELYLLDPDEVDAGELGERAAELTDRERSLRDTTSDTDEILREVSIPPQIVLLSVNSPVDEDTPLFGENLTIEIELVNVGDEAVNDAVVALTSDDIDVDEEELAGTIAPGDDYGTAVSVPLQTGGTVEFTATVESENAGSVSDTYTVEVRTKTSIVQTAIEILETLRERIEASELNPGQIQSKTSKIDAALDSLDRALSEIDRGRNKQANNAIRTATNQLGALLNHLDAASKEDPSAGDGRSLIEDLRIAVENQTELTIDHLADARDTRIR
ncbi:MAG: CARDB domain-containing protein [Natrinema limicola]